MKLLILTLVLVAGTFEAFCSEPASPDVIKLAIGDQTLVFRKISPSRDGLDYPDFFMLETEVTNAQFKEYLNTNKKTKDDADVLRVIKEREKSGAFSTGDIPYRIEDETTIWRKGNYPKALANHPVTLITLHDATAFCTWLTEQHPGRGIFRLPTWNEWMIAAYGRTRKYPWGEEWKNNRVHMSYGFSHDMLFENGEVVVKDSLPKRTESVTARPQGRTPEGLYGMLGNVEEYIMEGEPTSKNYFNLGCRWMGGGFTTGSLAEKDECVLPRQDYWGYSHHATARECDLGFRVILDPRKDWSLLKRPQLFEQGNKAWMIEPKKENPRKTEDGDKD